MPFNLLLFPLIGGYYILIRFEYLRYRQYRLENQRVLLNSAMLGIFLLGACLLVRSVLLVIAPQMVLAISNFLPVKTPFFGTASMSLLVAILATEIANKFINREKAIRHALTAVGNEFELLLSSSFTNGHLLQFTLSNNKFYIGWVKELPKPFTTNYIRITPAFSGYRDDKKELIFTTQYLSVYATYIEEGSVENMGDLKTDLVIKVDTVTSVSFFDINMYSRFNPDKE
ncbi:MAG: hypothetical protein EOO88_04240 [Pedobacter sp.]|nr:MAG: hypothetical protein EOO88_04240 [Pedobacter sp.]